MDKILISTTSFATDDTAPLQTLEKAGYSYRLNPFGRKLTPDEIVKLAQDATGIIAGTETFNKDVLQKLPNLKAISRCGVGLDNIDLTEANKLKIKISIADNGIAIAVSELVLGLTLSLLRQVYFMDRQIRNRKWNKIMGGLLERKNVGVIGLGRIGKGVAEIFKKNSAIVSYYDPYITETETDGFKKLSLEDLLRTSDIVTLHLSYSKNNLNFIGLKELTLMKNTAFLINCSRGGIVDESSLYTVLKEKKIAAAAIDVFTEEPYNGPLKELKNIILTPHIGSYAKESRIKMEKQAAENLVNALK